jgi:hypothetical protein
MSHPLTAAGSASAGQAQEQGRVIARVDLYWLPLGAGEPLGIVRRSGRTFEAVEARYQHRARCDLYHSALKIHLGDDTFVIEMAPVWGNKQTERGVVGEGPVGLPWLAHSRFFRYEIRRWQGGIIPDQAYAVASPVHIPTDPVLTRRLVELVPAFPTVTWGRDELRAGEMWNSNSLTAWLLARSGHDTAGITMPPHGRAPGWEAGLRVSARQQASDHEQAKMRSDGAPAYLDAIPQAGHARPANAGPRPGCHDVTLTGTIAEGGTACH